MTFKLGVRVIQGHWKW